jgi:hypothetical protein
MFIFLWQKAAANPEETTRFCCLPCIIPMKYLPWCFFALSMIFGANMGIFIGCLTGYYQHMVAKRSIIQLPMSLYNKVESLLPNYTKEALGFVPIKSV